MQFYNEQTHTLFMDSKTWDKKVSMKHAGYSQFTGNKQSLYLHNGATILANVVIQEHFENPIICMNQFEIENYISNKYSNEHNDFMIATLQYQGESSYYHILGRKRDVEKYIDNNVSKTHCSISYRLQRKRDILILSVINKVLQNEFEQYFHTV